MGRGSRRSFQIQSKDDIIDIAIFQLLIYLVSFNVKSIRDPGCVNDGRSKRVTSNASS